MSWMLTMLWTAALSGGPLPQPQPVSVRTADGALLRGRRYAGGGAPVLLLHGLVANLFQFDRHEDGGPALSAYLAARGHDVWLFNFRGAGTAGLESLLPQGRRGWSADDLILEDLPALVEHVRRSTGRRPFLLGHSLGGMVLAAYLTGATRDPAGPRAGPVLETSLAAARGRTLRGAIFLSAPARLAWTEEREPRAVTALARRLGRARWLPARIRLSYLTRLHSQEAPRAVREGLQRLEDFLLREIASGDLWGLAFGRHQKRARALVRKFRGNVLSDTSRDTLRQLARGVREGAWVSLSEGPEGPVRYDRHYDRIRLPLLVLVGAEDRIADPGVVRQSFFEEVRSRDRTFHTLAGYAHTDVTLSPEAERDVFPLIAEWIGLRALD